MKTNQYINKLGKVVLLGSVLLTANGCKDEEVTQGKVEDLSSFAQNFIGMKMASSNAMRQNSDAAINQTFRATAGSTNKSKNGRNLDEGFASSDSTDTGGGDIYYDPWVTCAVVTETYNEDGSYTSIYDYGDGCEEGWGDYKYFMHGKYTQTYSNSQEVDGSAYTSAYNFNTVYDNYGGHYDTDSSNWFTDGSSTYEGLSTYDTLSQKFSGYYNFSDNTTYGYNNQVNHYISSGKTTYDENGSVVLSSEYEYSEGDNSYHSKVTKPLVLDYSCNQNTQGGAEMKALIAAPYYWVYVSGHEAVSYTQDGQSGSFEIDYGNGECDNIIHIIENGVVVEIDMSAMMMQRNYAVD